MPEGMGYPKGKDILGKVNQGDLSPDVAKRPNEKLNMNPNQKVKQGDLGSAADGKQPNQQPTNVDFAKDAPRKGESETALKNNNYPTKSGSEHVQESLFKLADEKDY